MKKALTLMATLVIAFSMSMPVFAKKHSKKSENTSTENHGKAHTHHAKKKGATKGDKKGQ